MSLTNDSYNSIRHFEKYGFASFKKIINQATIQQIKAFFIEKKEGLNKYCLDKYNVTLEESGELAKSLEGHILDDNAQDRFLFSGVFPTIDRLSDDAATIFNEPKLIELLQELLSSKNIYAHLPLMARYVIPNSQTAAVPPHRDRDYNNHLSNFLTVWIPLVDINKSCGGVSFYVGENNQRCSNVDENITGFWHDAMNISGLDCQSPHLSVGDVLIFNSQVIHGSANNTSNNTRFSLDLRFFSERDSSTKHYINILTKEKIAPKDAK